MEQRLVQALLIEDSAGDAFLVEQTLGDVRSVQFELARVGRLEDGLERLAQDHFDVVLLDLGLPDSQGIDTLAAVSGQEQDVAVIVLTGLDDPAVGIEAVRQGAADYLVKGQVDAELVERAILQAIERQRLRSELERKTRELAASEARMRAVIERNLDAIVVFDDKGDTLFVNPAAEKLYGREAKDMVGWPFTASREGSGTREMGVLGRDGRSSTVERRIVDIEWDGKPAGMAVLHDITERKRAETALRKSERQLAVRNRVAQVLLTVPDDEMFGQVLDVVMDALSSEYGLFGYVREDGALVCPSMTRATWERCEMQDGDLVFPREERWGIWGRALTEMRTVCSNEPSDVPEGHIPITRALDVPVLHHGEVIGNLIVGNKPANYDEDDVELLEAVADYVAPVLSARLERKRAEATVERFEGEFAAARRVQEKLFPKSAPCLPGFDIAGLAHAAESTAGDYYDFIPMDDGCLGVVVGDVTSHGLGPALLMSETRAFLRAFNTMVTDVGEVLSFANRLLYRDIREDAFVTLFFGRLDPETSMFEYAAAGHGAHLMDSSGRFTTLRSTTYPLGVEETLAVPTPFPVALKPGQILAVLTDGVHEASRLTGDFFGLDRARDIIRTHRRESADEIASRLVEAALAFCEGKPLDDITAVIVKVVD